MALDGGEWSASRSGRFVTGVRAPGWIEGWVGPRAGLDAAVKRKNPCPYRESNPGLPSRRCHKGREFFDQVIDRHLLEKDSVP
jgi:hypothetical protein